MNATFYIVLDGLNQLESEPSHPLAQILDRMMASIDQPLLQIRAFVTGQPASMSGILRAMEQRPLEVNLSPSESIEQDALNHDDILLYAEAGLKDIPFYRQTQESENRTMKDRVKQTLALGVRGDFDLLKLKLSEIAEAREEAKVEEILRRANEDRAQAIERHVKQLDERLTVREIEELNVMLIWAISGIGWPSISLLDSALSLQPGTNRLLGYLDQRIRDRYSELFNIDDIDADEAGRPGEATYAGL